MSVERYYLSEDAYAYPSSNANDGGDDNTEYNLKTITDKFAIKSFVVRRQGRYQNYFLLGYSDDPVGVKITGGECSINGYYFDLNDIVIETNKKDGKTVLTPLTKYNIVLRIYKDGNDNLRGDGTALVGPNIGKLECRGIVASLMTDDEYNSIDKNFLLLLGHTVTDSQGYLYNSDYVQDSDRFSFIDANTVLTESGRKIEDWVQESLNSGLSHLSQLNYYSEESDESPKSTLKIIEDGGLVYQTTDGQEISSFNVVDINNRTNVSEKDKYTESKFTESLSGSPEDSDNWNGESDLICRSDHNHDRRYILRTSDNNEVTQVVETNLKVVKDLITGRLSVASPDGSEVTSFDNDGSSKLGQVEITESGDLSGIKNLTASGDIRAGRVFNAVWNDYADALKKNEGLVTEPGDIISKDPEGFYKLSSSDDPKMVVGVHSDTYGHLLGGDQDRSVEDNLSEYVPVAVAGNVRVKLKGPASCGDLVVASDAPGVGVVTKEYVPGTVVGKVLENKEGDSIERVLVQVMLM